MAEFYPMRQDWMRSLRLSVGSPVVLCYLVYLSGFFHLMSRQGAFPMWLLSLLYMVVGATCALFLSLPVLRLCTVWHLLYVRRNGRLWQVDLRHLQVLGVFPASSGRFWRQWPESTRHMVQRAVLLAIDEAERGLPLQEQVLLPMDRVRLERETPWYWQVSFEAGGARRLQTIPKAYEDFAPVPGLARASGPVPGRWGLGCFILLTAAVFIAGGLLMFRPADARSSPQPPADTSASQSAAVSSESREEPSQVRVPEESAAYWMNGLEFRTDKSFRLQEDKLIDPALNVDYEISLQYGVDSGDLPDLPHVGERYRYQLTARPASDGQTEYAGTALSEDGTLFSIRGVSKTAAGGEKMQGDMRYILENLTFTGPAVTEENFRTLLRPNLQAGCAYMGPAYLRAPSDLFGYPAFVDTYLPYSQDVFYSDGADTVETRIHGLRVRVSIRPCRESAQEILNQMRQELAITFRPNDIFDEKYDPNLDAACFLGAYYDRNSTTPRVLVLHTIRRWDGYYTCREITCFPEEIDGEYAPMLQELEEVYGLKIPTLERLAE